jgi:hypothetical protein
MVGDKQNKSFNEIKGFLSLQLELRLELEGREQKNLKKLLTNCLAISADPM